MKYLGIRYLKKWANEKIGKIKDTCEYGKYHGDEWLKNEDFDIFCIQGKKICLSQFEYNEKEEKRIEAVRKCYDLENEKWVLKYIRVKI